MSIHMANDVHPAHPAARAAGSWRRRSRGLRGALLAAAVTLLVALAAGCGGGGKDPGVANLGSGTTTTGGVSSGNPAAGASSGTPSAGSGSSSGSSGGNAQFAIAGGAGKLARFADCMRTHGLPNFPQPNAQGVISGNTANGIDPSSPQFQHAQQSCAKDLPDGTPSPAQAAQMRAKAVAFSACMRAHGEPNFPDPAFHGGTTKISIQIGQGSGIDPRSPQFQHAQQACQSILPGRLGGGPLPAGGGTTGGK
jgi:hypothetical protein